MSAPTSPPSTQPCFSTFHLPTAPPLNKQPYDFAPMCGEIPAQPGQIDSVKPETFEDIARREHNIHEHETTTPAPATSKVTTSMSISAMLNPTVPTLKQGGDETTLLEECEKVNGRGASKEGTKTDCGGKNDKATDIRGECDVDTYRGVWFPRFEGDQWPWKRV